MRNKAIATYFRNDKVAASLKLKDGKDGVYEVTDFRNDKVAASLKLRPREYNAHIPWYFRNDKVAASLKLSIASLIAVLSIKFPQR